MTPTEVTEKLGLLRMKDRTWYCHPSNALEGDGLFEGEVHAPGCCDTSRSTLIADFRCNCTFADTQA